MSIIRDTITGLPAACGVPEDLAPEYSRHLGKLFDIEVQNHTSSLSRGKFGDASDRLSVGFSWLRFADRKAAAVYGFKLLNYTSAVIDLAQGKPVDGLAETRVALEAEEKFYPEVAALMTVEQASTMSSWD